MSLMSAILIGLGMGVVFGVALEKSRVFEPGMILGQMQLKNFIMLRVFLSAVATGTLVYAFLSGLGFITLSPKAALYAADVLGGLLLGVGIALAGACPGTVLVQIGAGYRDALFTLLGGLCGAVFFSYVEPTLQGTILSIDGGKVLLTDVIGIPFWVGSLTLFTLLALALFAMEAHAPASRELGHNVDGDFAVHGTSRTTRKQHSAVAAE